MVPMVLALGVRPLLRASKGPSALYGHRAETHWRVQIARPIGEGRASGQQEQQAQLVSKGWETRKRSGSAASRSRGVRYF
jgi:hypothetical protein